VILTEMGANKIAVIKEVRSAVPGLALRRRSARRSAPKTIKEGVTKQEADEIKKKIEAAGARSKSNKQIKFERCSSTKSVAQRQIHNKVTIHYSRQTYF